jgi:tetratricopeptide (TPR) repeat protein
MAKAAKPKSPTASEPPKRDEPATAAPAKAAKPKPPSPPQPVADDPSLDALTAGLAALQAKDWAKAVERFEAAVELSDRPEVKDRARQFLTASRQKAGGGGKGPESDPYLQALYEKNRGNLAEALEMSRKGGRDQKDERFAYLAASIHAVENRLDEAAEGLAKAVELNPKNRIHAFHDPDFAELRKNRDLRPLFGLT